MSMLKPREMPPFPKESVQPPKSLPRGLAAISEAKEALREIYLVLLKIEIDFNPWCRRCKKEKATEGHHPWGQIGILILLFIPFCRRCHDHIHNNPNQSRAEGWLREHKPNG